MNNKSGASATLEGTLWALESVADNDGNLNDAIAGVEATVEFRGGRLSGNASCNRFTGSYAAEGDILSVGRLASTMMACPDEGRMTQERHFTAGLHAAAFFSIEDGRLTISNNDGKVVMVFRGLPPTALAGTHWVATMVNDGRQAVTSVVEGTEISITFEEDGRLAGSAGCNRYMAAYKVDGESISIDPPGTTRRYCDGDGVMEQEQAYLAKLQEVATYRISGERLELRTAEGALVAAYRAAAAAA